MERDQILAIRQDQGRSHDFKIYKESGHKVHPDKQVFVDSGYQGLAKLHNKTSIPKKKSKKNPLTEEDKKINKEISKKRVKIENVFGELKRFKIIAVKYRGRRKRFGLRFTLIAAIYNISRTVG